MTTTVPPLRRSAHPQALEHYPIAAASSARVLEAEGCARAAETVRQVASHIVAASPWPAEVCMCAVVPCTQTNWTHPGHCCRTAGDHADLFDATHRRVCVGPNHTRGPR